MELSIDGMDGMCFTAAASIPIPRFSIPSSIPRFSFVCETAALNAAADGIFTITHSANMLKNQALADSML